MVVVVSFHPVMSGSLAIFLVFVLVVVFVRTLIVANAVVLVVLFFHPQVASCFAVFL